MDDMMKKETVQLARFSDDYKHIIDSSNTLVKLNDPRVVHIWPLGINKLTSDMIGNAFKKRGLRFRSTGAADKKTLLEARKLCSGRECLPCMNITGETVKDILENRNEEDISIYHNYDLTGPCQSGAWRMVWDTFAERLQLKNTVFMASTNLDNRYLGGGERLAQELSAAVILGDIFEEAEFALKCLATDRKRAELIFHQATEKVIAGFKKSLTAVSDALKAWAAELSAIPLKMPLAQAPKILIFGGMGVLYIYHEIKDFLIEQGVVPKIEELSLGFNISEGRRVLRHGMERGLSDPLDHFNRTSTLLSTLNLKNGFVNTIKTNVANVHMAAIWYFIRKYRKIASRSGLLHHTPLPYTHVVTAGHDFSTINSDSETSMITGLYKCSLDAGHYDGYIHISYFTCLPSLAAQGINKKVAITSDRPFIAMDCDGPAINANQRRLLETVAVQAKRIRLDRSKRGTGVFSTCSA